MTFYPTQACVAGTFFDYPYFHKATQTVMYYIAPTPGAGFLNAGDNSANQFAQTALQLNAINKANPDWLQLLDVSSAQSYTGLTGGGVTGLSPNLCFALVTITPPIPANIDLWWGNSGFAKLGFLAFGTINCKTPVYWVNFVGTVAFDNLTYWNNLTYFFQKGVIASIITQARIPLPPISWNGSAFVYPE